LVALGGVEGEFGEDFAVGGDDGGVVVVDEADDLGAVARVTPLT